LLLEGLGEVAVARFQFLEQTHVLHGDHGLVGEGLQEINALVCESREIVMRYADRTDRSPLAEHRHEYGAAGVAGRVVLPESVRRVRVVLNVWDIQNGTIRDAAKVVRLGKRSWEPAAVSLEALRSEIVTGREISQVVLEAIDGGGFRITQTGRARYDRV